MAQGESADQRADREDAEHPAGIGAAVPEHRDDPGLDGGAGGYEHESDHGREQNGRFFQHDAEFAAAARNAHAANLWQ